MTPLAVGAQFAGERAHTDLFDPQSEFDVGHIRLARDADLIVVAPATADLIARKWRPAAPTISPGAVLLANDKPVLLAPAMNPRMWAASKATQRNFAQLRADGVRVIGPNVGRNGGTRRGQD